MDRVGPFEAQFQIEKVEDTRAEKRRKILDRAKLLLSPAALHGDTRQQGACGLVQSEVKISEIATYGPEQLPAGPEVGKSNEVIMVEGRADVITLLRNDIKNAVAIGGATSNIPKSIISLANEKEATVFVDGDRGGDMVIRSLLNVCEIDFVAKAPDGKEVEELTRKEVIKALRTKIPLDQYLGQDKNRHMHQGVNRDRNDRNDRRDMNANSRPQGQPFQSQPFQRDQPEQVQAQAPQPQKPQPSEGNDIFDEVEKPYIKDLRSTEDMHERPEIQRMESSPLQREGLQQRESASVTKPILESALLAQLANGLVELSGTLRSRVYAPDGSVIKEVAIRELLNFLQDTRGAYAIVLDGVITQRLVEISLEKGIKAIYGIRANPMPRRHPELILYTKEQGKLE